MAISSKESAHVTSTSSMANLQQVKMHVFIANSVNPLPDASALPRSKFVSSPPTKIALAAQMAVDNYLKIELLKIADLRPIEQINYFATHTHQVTCPNNPELSTLVNAELKVLNEKAVKFIEAYRAGITGDIHEVLTFRRIPAGNMSADSSFPSFDRDQKSLSGLLHTTTETKPLFNGL